MSGLGLGKGLGLGGGRGRKLLLFHYVDGELRADHLAEAAGHAEVGFAHTRGVVTLEVELGGKLQYIARAELNAKAAPLASLPEYFHAAVR